jgi:hypothetical protein
MRNETNNDERLYPLEPGKQPRQRLAEQDQRSIFFDLSERYALLEGFHDV